MSSPEPRPFDAVLDGERLQLRPLQFDDVDDIFAYAADPRVSEHLSWKPHLTPDDSRAFIAWAFDRRVQGLPAPWAIVERASDRVIGTASFLGWQQTHRYADIGYVLGAEYWGQGYATEAACLLIGHGFQAMGLNRIEAQIRVTNIVSAHVLEKAGLHREATLQQRFWIDGQFHDSYLYAVLREQWLGDQTAGDPALNQLH